MTQPAQAKKGRRGLRVYSWPPQPPHDLEVVSVTSLIGEGLPKPALVGWAAKVVAECAVDDHELVAAMLKKPDGEQKALEYVKGARWRTTRKAADRGTIVHAAIESYVAGKPLSSEQLEEKLVEARVPRNLWKSAAGMVAGAVEFLTDLEPEVLHSEATVYSREHGYAGTTDLVVKLQLGGSVKPAIVDFKTSKAIYDDVSLQLAAYAYADFVGLNDGTELPLADEPIRDGVVVRPMASGRYEAAAFSLTPDLFDVFLAVKGVALGKETIAAARRPKF